DPGHWQAKTRGLEDRLSDTLHEKLMQRFIDRRTSVLMRALHVRDEVLAGGAGGGTGTGRGQYVGKVRGLPFAPASGARAPGGKRGGGQGAARRGPARRGPRGRATAGRARGRSRWRVRRAPRRRGALAGRGGRQGRRRTAFLAARDPVWRAWARARARAGGAQ